MLCPKCKNPIEDNTTECEWCGEVLQKKTEKETVYCPKCKNPIGKNVTECEWCGDSCWEKYQKNSFNKELINLLKDTPLSSKIDNNSYWHPATKMYQKATGKSLIESVYYVMRLNFFRLHNNANEAEWNAQWKTQWKTQRNSDSKISNKGCLILFVIWLCFVIYYIFN